MNICYLKTFPDINQEFETSILTEWIVNKKITDIQFRIICLLKTYYQQSRTRPELKNINSEYIATHLKQTPKQIRKVFNDMAKNPEVLKYFSFYFDKSMRRHNLPDTIIITHKYIVNPVVNIDKKYDEFTNKQISDLQNWINQSEKFKDTNANQLIDVTGALNYNELIIGLKYIEQRKNTINNPVGYLRSVFKKGVFIDKNKIVENTKPIQIQTRLKINEQDQFIFLVDHEELTKLPDDYKVDVCELLNGKYEVTKITYHTKPANISETLKRFAIKYEVRKIKKEMFATLQTKQFNKRKKNMISIKEIFKQSLINNKLTE